MNTTDRYGDIIWLTYRGVRTRPQMPRSGRAAQFSPFAALTGYEDVLAETARPTGERRELSEYEQDRLNAKLGILEDNIRERPEVKIVFWVPDERKAGGEYVTVSGAVRRIDEEDMTIVFVDGRRVSIADIYDIEGEIFAGAED